MSNGPHEMSTSDLGVMPAGPNRFRSFVTDMKRDFPTMEEFAADKKNRASPRRTRND